MKRDLSYSPDWEDAAKRSRYLKAVSEQYEALVWSKTHKARLPRRLEVIKPLYADAYIVYASTSIKIPGRLTPHEIDSIKKWKPY